MIQFAKLSGFSPIITTASPKHEEYLQSLGATHVIDRSIPLSSLPDEIAKLTTKPITTIFDAVSAPETQQAGYDILGEGGDLILVLDSKISVPSEGKSVKRILGSFALPHTRELGVKFYASLGALLEEGAIKVCHFL